MTTASTPELVSPTVRDVDADVADRLARQIAGRRDHLRTMAYTAGRTQADAYRRVVAAGIAPALRYEDLRDAARRSPAEAAELGLRRPGWWRALAMTVGYQNLYPEDLTDAARMYRVARHMSPKGRWRPDETRLYLQILQLTGAVDELEAELRKVREVDEEDRLTLEIDLAAARHGLGSDAWNTRLDVLLGRWDVRPVRLADDGATPFDRLSAAGPAGTEDGPLVTVVMSAFRPGREIFSAVRSILAQTWGNFELLVLDDASGPEFRDILAEVRDLDDRIRVLVQPENRGTYAARNRALGEARGEFVTFQDSDDWSHPERLARQVRPLLDGPSSVHSTLSRSIRTTEELGFQHLAKQTSRKNASSLMFPRAVMERLGAFDPVRKNGDSEFIERLTAALPGEQVLLPDQLAFVRLTAGSLSRGDFRARWIHPARQEYTESYRAWHQRIRAGAAPYVSPDPARRSFPTPRKFAHDTGVPVEQPDVQVVLAGDFRGDAPTAVPLYDEVVTLLEHGLRVGIMQFELGGRPEANVRPLSPEFRRLIDDGTVTHVLQTEPARTDLLLFHDPAVLQLPPTEPQALEAGRVAILAHQGGADSVSGALWSAQDVTRAARDLFGKEPLWVPADDAVRAELAAATDLQVHDSDVVAPVVPRLWSTGRPRTRSGPPKVGFASFEGADLWPATKEELLGAYPEDETVDVRLLGFDHARDILGRRPADWLVYRNGDVSQREHLLQLDVVPCFPDDSVRRPPAFLTRALAGGSIVIVPERFRPVLGDAAVYAKPADVLELVERLEHDPAQRDELARAAARHLETRHDPRSFARLVDALLPDDADVDAAVPPLFGVRRSTS